MLKILDIAGKISFLMWPDSAIFTLQTTKVPLIMKKIIVPLFFSVLFMACGSKQPKAVQKEVTQKDTVQVAPVSELGMWKIASYASTLGDNRNANYITNSYAIWGTFTNSTNENAELKVKFVVDKETFCIKLLEYGTRAVKKGDETQYKINVKPASGTPFDFTAKNVSDRLFIKEQDARKMTEIFTKGGQISFYAVTDSKTNPARYSFTIDNAEGFGNALQKLTK